MGKPAQPPSLAALFTCFFVIGAQSFGGGLSAWIRRAVVTQRGWMEERAFLAGLAVCQIAPGPNALNLAVFIGTTLRGGPGALVSLAGLLLVPVVATLAAGLAYFAGLDFAWLRTALAGAGAAAIGLILANGLQLAPRAAAGLGQVGLMLFVTAALGLARWSLGDVLLAALPAGLLLALWQERRKAAP